MEKINGTNKDILLENLFSLKELFPDIFNENKLNVNLLEEKLGVFIDNEEEKYSFNWKGKKAAKKLSIQQSKATIRPSKLESKNWDNTENLYIEGDNLEVLKLLQKSFYNKIDTIYIDPPYNTGRDILYKNDYSAPLDYYLNFTGQKTSEGFLKTTNTENNGRFHSDWLSMMYSRLLLARNLLSDKGFITLAIDHNELANLTLLCDEIFGEENKIGIITVVSKPEGRNQEKFFATSTEYALFYAKNKNICKFSSVILDEEILKTFDRTDEKGKFRPNNYIRLGGGNDNLRVNKPTFFYPIYVSKDLSHITLEYNSEYYEKFPITSSQERTWKTKKETFLERLNSGEVYAELDKNGDVQIYEKYRIENGQLIKTHWDSKKYNFISTGTKILEDLMGEKTFDYPKSLYYVKDIVNLTSSKNSIVLDFFSGSSTTAHAVMQLNTEDRGNRRFIMVQVPEKIENNKYSTICDIAKERIRRAGEKIKQEFLKNNENLKLGEEPKEFTTDIGFKVFKLDSSNIKAWDSEYAKDNIQQSLLDSISNIKEDRTELDLLFELLLKQGLDLTTPITEIKANDKVIYNIGAGALYVSLSDNITVDVAEKIIEENKIYNSPRVTVIFKDNGFKNDVDKTNVIQTLKVSGISDIKSI